MGKIFISYAREDSEIAERIYRDLQKMGADPWIDIHDLLPGQKWAVEIRRIIRESSHFLVLISKNSINKRGFVQSEIKQAIEVLSEIPSDDIYLIPVRLDETNPSHEKLRELHWVDLFPSYSTALSKIQRTLTQSNAILQKITTTHVSEELHVSDNGKASERDSKRIKSFRKIFDRPAFYMPCIFESSLSKIEQAIKDISAAMATGTLYSRDKMLLAQTTPSGEFETKLYQAVLEKIRSDIHVLQRIITELIEHIEDAEGKVDWRTGADGLDTPYCMDHLLYHMVEKGVSRQFVSRAFRFMDDVDECRNSILSKVNKLLELSGTRKLPLITKSSVQLEKSEKIEITEISEPHPYGNYYLTFARPLRAFLNNEPGYLLTKNLNLPDFIDKTLYDYLGIITISDLVKFSRQELLACNEIGIQQLNEIEKALADFGFSLS